MGALISTVLGQIFGPQPARILMVGLDNAGKTTVLYKLKLGEALATLPTIGFNVESVVFKNIQFTVWDVGGQTKIRPLWQHYYENNDAIIYVVDGSDRERMKESREELHYMLSDDRLKNSILLIFNNKIDLPHSQTPTEVVDKLDLRKFWDRTLFVQSTCATSGDGIVDGLEWLAENIKKKIKKTY